MSEGEKKILIVEDERPLAKALELKLNKEGLNTVIATNGEEAQSLLSNEKFDLLILDIVMPKFDGFHVLEFVQKKYPETKVIILSNLSQEEDIKKAESFGAVEYFIKSNTPIVNLVENVKKVLE